jgi:hypothetical protein
VVCTSVPPLLTIPSRGSRLVRLDLSAESSTDILNPLQYLLAISLRVGLVDATSIDELVTSSLASDNTGLVRWKKPDQFLHASIDKDITLNMDKRLSPDKIEIILAQAIEQTGLDMYGQKPKVNRKRMSTTDVGVQKLSKVSKVAPSSRVKSSRSPPSVDFSGHGTVPIAGSVAHVDETPQRRHPSVSGYPVGGSASRVTIMEEYSGLAEQNWEDYTDGYEQLTEQDLLSLDTESPFSKHPKPVYVPTQPISTIANNPYFATYGHDDFSQGLLNDDFDALTPLNDELNGDSNASAASYGHSADANSHRSSPRGHRRCSIIAHRRR